ncbi:MAG: hypothetical protein N4A49_15575 [Marinifilaceae bacterium]|jgi:hypothetical protein|nr:hypothetical protein [Marinifilaceae bacterium]
MQLEEKSTNDGYLNNETNIETVNIIELIKTTEFKPLNEEKFNEIYTKFGIPQKSENWKFIDLKKLLSNDKNKEDYNYFQTKYFSKIIQLSLKYNRLIDFTYKVTSLLYKNHPNESIFKHLAVLIGKLIESNSENVVDNEVNEIDKLTSNINKELEKEIKNLKISIENKIDWHKHIKTKLTKIMSMFPKSIKKNEDSQNINTGNTDYLLTKTNIELMIHKSPFWNSELYELLISSIQYFRNKFSKESNIDYSRKKIIEIFNKIFDEFNRVLFTHISNNHINKITTTIKESNQNAIPNISKLNHTTQYMNIPDRELEEISKAFAFFNLRVDIDNFEHLKKYALIENLSDLKNANAYYKKTYKYQENTKDFINQIIASTKTELEKNNYSFNFSNYKPRK